jgi:hypothetical protein
MQNQPLNAFRQGFIQPRRSGCSYRARPQLGQAAPYDAGDVRQVMTTLPAFRSGECAEC